MAANSAENSPLSGDHKAIVANVREYLAGLPESEKLNACLAEGDAIAAIVRPLGLPAKILAAVHAYPLFSAEILSPKQYKTMN